MRILIEASPTNAGYFQALHRLLNGDNSVEDCEALIKFAQGKLAYIRAIEFQMNYNSALSKCSAPPEPPPDQEKTA